MFLFLFLDFGEQIFGEYNNGAIGGANIFKNNFIRGFVGDLEGSLIPQLVPPFLFQKVEGLIEEGAKDIGEVALDRKLVGVQVMVVAELSKSYGS